MVRTSGHVEDVTWGEAITQGQCVYRLSTDGEWYKAQCDDSAAASGYGTGCGIALTAGSNGQPGKVQRNGVTRVRPAIATGWTATFIFMVNLPEYVAPDMLHGLLNDAGRLIGIADFRPTYGRFSVSQFALLKD